MSDSKNNKSWFERLTGIFRRRKSSSQGPKPELTREMLDRRAFTIMLITGLFFILATVLSSATLARVLAAVLAIACLVGAWLARRGKSVAGAVLSLLALYSTALISGTATSGGGLVLAAIIMALTLGFTSAVMPLKLARRVNILGLCVSSIPVFLDLFEPYSRPGTPNPEVSQSLGIVIILIFAGVIVRQFNTYNLRTKMIIAFAGVTVLPLLVVALYNNSRLTDVLYQNSQELLHRSANEAALVVDTFVENQEKEISVQAKNPSLIEFLSLDPAQREGTKEQKNAQDALNAFMSQDTKFIYASTLFDQNGAVILDKRTSKEFESLNSRPKVLKEVLSQDRIQINGPFVNQENRKASLYFSAPIKNKVGISLGVLVLEYDANVIESIIESAIQPEKNESILFHVVDKNNFVVIANTGDRSLLYKSYKNLTPAQIQALQQEGVLLPQDALIKDEATLTGLENSTTSSFFITSFQSQAVGTTKDLNSAVQLKNTSWLVFVSQPETAILNPLLLQRRTTVLIFLVLSGLIILAALGISQLLASPILRLATTAQKIAAGDLSLQSDIVSNDEIGTLAQSFNEMAIQTRALINSLEQRSKALATSSEVSRRISTILDQEQLVTEVVKQVQTAFNYYHAHIYLLDEKTQELIMAGGTGEAGKAMLARGHKIPMGKGLVGRAAQNNVTVLVTDVAQEPQWLPNPLLPDTKSEVAVPISIAEKVLGVLDVQHNVADILKQEDVDVLQSIANQVAFAVRNARSYAEVEAKADREALITSIGQKIQNTITIESALQVAIREIGRALNGVKTHVVLNENSTSDVAIEEEQPQ